jgi:hypothetical protein
MHRLQRVHRDCNERARNVHVRFGSGKGTLRAACGIGCCLGKHFQEVVRLSSRVDKGEPQHGVALPLGRNTQNSAFKRKSPRPATVRGVIPAWPIEEHDRECGLEK